MSSEFSRFVRQLEKIEMETKVKKIKINPKENAKYGLVGGDQLGDSHPGASVHGAPLCPRKNPTYLTRHCPARLRGWLPARAAVRRLNPGQAFQDRILGPSNISLHFSKREKKGDLEKRMQALGWVARTQRRRRRRRRGDGTGGEGIKRRG